MNVNSKRIVIEKTCMNEPVSVSDYHSTEIVIHRQSSDSKKIFNYKSPKNEIKIDNQFDPHLNNLISNKTAIDKISPIISTTSPTISAASNSSINTFLNSSNNLVIDEDSYLQSNSFCTNNQHDSSPTTGNYSSLIELKENVFERKYNYKIFEFNVMKLKQKKLKQQQQQFSQQASDDCANPLIKPLSSQELDHQIKHDYYEITRKLQDNLRKQKVLFSKAANLLNSELKVQIMNFNLNKSSSVNRNNNLNHSNADYFCKQCNCGFDLLNGYLNHLYTDEHQKYTGSITTPTPQALNINGSNVFLDELNIVEKSPLKGLFCKLIFLNTKNLNFIIKGVEFLFPTRAFYCSLCDELCDNETLTDLHLRSVAHTNKYQVCNTDHRK